MRYLVASWERRSNFRSLVFLVFFVNGCCRAPYPALDGNGLNRSHDTDGFDHASGIG